MNGSLRIVSSSVMLVAAMALASTARADTLELPVMLTGDVAEGQSGSYVLNELSLHGLDFSADMASYDTIAWHAEAPPGQFISVGPPPGETSYLVIDLIYGNPQTTSVWMCPTVAYDADVTLIDPSGNIPEPLAVEVESCIPDGGSGTSISVHIFYRIEGPFSFRGFDIEAVGPFLSNGSEQFELLNDVVWSFYCLDDVGGDGDQWTYYEPLPPGSGGGGGGLGGGAPS